MDQDITALKETAERVFREIVLPLGDKEHPLHTSIPALKECRLDEYVRDVCLGVMNDIGMSQDLAQELIAHGFTGVSLLEQFLRDKEKGEEAQLLEQFRTQVTKAFDVNANPFSIEMLSQKAPYSEEMLERLMRFAVAVLNASSFIQDRYAGNKERPVHTSAAARDLRICELFAEAAIGDEVLQRCYTHCSFGLNFNSTPMARQAHTNVAEIYQHRKPVFTDAYVRELFERSMESYHYVCRGAMRYEEQGKLVSKDKVVKKVQELQELMGDEKLDIRKLPGYADISAEAQKASRGAYSAGRAKGS